MQDLLNIQTLTLFLYFIVPGFVAMQVYDLLVPTSRRNFNEAVINIVTYSFINLALLSPVINWVEESRSGWRWLVWYFCLFGSPTLLALIWYGLRKSNLLKGRLVHPTPTGWDHFFKKGEACWILFHMKDGTHIGGYFAGNSLASSFPNPQDVYVEKAYYVQEINNELEFTEPVPNTRGLIIPMQECQYIEMYKMEGVDYGEDNSQ